MQKTIFAAALAATIGMGSAQAADLRTTGSLKDAPEYVPASTWTGFYLGAGGGIGATSSDLKALSGSYTVAEANGIGGMGGFGTVQVGYDRQLDQHFVAGVFADYDFASIDSKLSLFNGHISFPFNLTDSWTVGGRVGYLVNANTLVYGLAGYTEAHFDLPHGAQNNTFSGWTAGAGIETSLGGPLFLKGEYRFTQLGEQTTLHPNSELRASHCGKVTDQPDIQTGRLVLVYKLNTTDYAPLK